MIVLLCLQYTATSVFSSLNPRVLKHDEFVCVQYSEERHQHSRDSNTCSSTSPPVQSTSHLSDCGGDDCLSNRRDNRSSQVVYASLNHLTPTPSSTAPRQTREEFSEYASIRVSWYHLCGLYNQTKLSSIFKFCEAVQYSLANRKQEMCACFHTTWYKSSHDVTFLVTSRKIGVQCGFWVKLTPLIIGVWCNISISCLQDLLHSKH